MYEFLQKIPLFAGMSAGDFARLCEMVEEVWLPAGSQLFAEGSPGVRAYVIRDGELEIVKRSGHREVLLAVRGAGEVIGEMSLVERAPRMATVRARTDASLLAIHQDELDKLLDSSPSAARAILRTVLARWRNTEGQLRESEKLAQLGTLSAGIAHELNNPAAAVRRGSEQLQEALEALTQAQAGLAALELTGQQRQRLAALLGEGSAAPAAGEPSALSRSDEEEGVERWLAERGVSGAWEHAAGLVDMGFDLPRTENLLRDVPADALPVVVALLTSRHAVTTLLRDVAVGATRISDIVQTLKSYTYLDQAPAQVVDVHVGLENTLAILGPRLAGIHVQRDYGPNIPPIEAYGSELNQAFTHILTNAIEALGGEGRIILRTRTSGNALLVEIEDNGPGIPEAIAGRVFDPFFTTKPPGQGAGLGLSASYNIVVVKHRGHLELSSRPGQTCCRLTLPLTFGQEIQARQPLPPPSTPEPERLREILVSARTIAVMGMSGDARKAAHTVPLYLRDQGYELLPVNPRGGRVAGLRVYGDLFSLPKAPDVVLVFRPSEEVPGIVAQAVQMGAGVLWLQRGIRHEEAAAEGRRAGLVVVMDTCMREAHRRLLGERPAAS